MPGNGAYGATDIINELKIYTPAPWCFTEDNKQYVTECLLPSDFESDAVMDWGRSVLGKEESHKTRKDDDGLNMAVPLCTNYMSLELIRKYYMGGMNARDKVGYCCKTTLLDDSLYLCPAPPNVQIKAVYYTRTNYDYKPSLTADG
jgi:hypothetical protein